MRIDRVLARRMRAPSSAQDVLDGCRQKGDCLVWIGRKSNGYGATRWAGESVGTHRLIWTLLHGEIPTGMFVMHKCDNPPCCNIDHLCLGTNAENQFDKARKGRQARGRRNGRTKLWPQQVAAIRRRLDAGRTQRDIASEFSISPSAVSKIKRGLLWDTSGIRKNDVAQIGA